MGVRLEPDPHAVPDPVVARGARGAPGARARLRRPVQPADRAPRARGRVYSELVSHRLTAAEIRARNPLALILSGGPASVYAEGAPQLDTGGARARDPDARDLLRDAADGARPRRQRRVERHLRVRQGRRRARRVGALPRPAARAGRVDEPPRLGDRASAGLARHRVLALDARSPHSRTRPRPLRRPVPPGGRAHAATGRRS